jgi:hypothetical protein
MDKEHFFVKETLVKRTKHDLHILQEDTIKCANCSKALIQVIKVKEDPSRVHAIMATCPFCGDSSFRYKIDGRIYVGHVPGTSILNYPIENINGVLYSTVKVAIDGKV